jgi:hypothetical protein
LSSIISERIQPGVNATALHPCGASSSLWANVVCGGRPHLRRAPRLKHGHGDENEHAADELANTRGSVSYLADCRA